MLMLLFDARCNTTCHFHYTNWTGLWEKKQVACWAELPDMLADASVRCLSMLLVKLISDSLLPSCACPNTLNDPACAFWHRSLVDTPQTVLRPRTQQLYFLKIYMIILEVWFAEVRNLPFRHHQIIFLGKMHI